MWETLAEYATAFGGGFAGVEWEEGAEAHGVGCAVHFGIVGGGDVWGGCGGEGLFVVVVGWVWEGGGEGEGGRGKVEGGSLCM